MPLIPYDDDAPPRGVFDRFQWAFPGVVARSSQPGYHDGHDHPHGMDQAAVNLLLAENIRTVISANAHPLDDASKTRLGAANIAYYHFPVADFQPHTTRQLEEASRQIRTSPAALVYCGYGQGRTGTIVAAWALTSRIPGVQRNAEYLEETFGVETDAQIHRLLAL